MTDKEALLNVICDFQMFLWYGMIILLAFIILILIALPVVDDQSTINIIYVDLAIFVPFFVLFALLLRNCNRK